MPGTEQNQATWASSLSGQIQRSFKIRNRAIFYNQNIRLLLVSSSLLQKTLYHCDLVLVLWCQKDLNTTLRDGEPESQPVLDPALLPSPGHTGSSVAPPGLSGPLTCLLGARPSGSVRRSRSQKPQALLTSATQQPKSLGSKPACALGPATAHSLAPRGRKTEGVFQSGVRISGPACRAQVEPSPVSSCITA